MPTTDTAPRKSSSRAAWWIAGGVAALALAFGAGRLTADRAPAARERAEPEHARAPAYEPPAPQPSAGMQPAAPAGTPPAATSPGAVALPAPGSPVRSHRSPVPPIQMEQYRAEVVTHVEQQRKRVVSTCWPKEGLPKGQRSATITYNVTFNPQGREVGRGIVQDRRAPAGKFAKCLSQLHGMQFSISPPGTYVTLRIPVTYP